MHLRGTGESFAANIRGRVLGTAPAWLTPTFSAAATLPSITTGNRREVHNLDETVSAPHINDATRALPLAQLGGSAGWAKIGVHAEIETLRQAHVAMRCQRDGTNDPNLHAS